MEEDITILTAFLLSNKPEIITQEEFDEVKQAIENLIKEFKKTKKENIEYQLGQTPDTTEDYKTLKKELEKWKNGEI